MAGPASHSYLSTTIGIRSWLLTTDHKRIALLYFASITFFFLVGGFAATLIRFELLTPGPTLGSPDFYNRLFTMHGVIMVWFFLIPSIPTTMGNFMIPLMIGAKDLAFPRLNLASWYLFIAGGALTIFSLLLGGIDTGWTFYEPYSTFYATGYVILAISGIFLSGFSSILTGLNFIVTVHKLRAPGMTWYRLPVFIWSTYTTSLILVLATPVLAMTLAMLLVEREFGVGIFSPALGGDPLLFQHMFWFYSHPAVYIMILPSMGVISEVVPVFARKPLFGYTFVVWCSIAIGVIGFLVWGHHMFVSGMSSVDGIAFSLFSMAVAVFSGV
jgi:cytochrome c oxidase subunit 1